MNRVLSQREKTFSSSVRRNFLTRVLKKTNPEFRTFVHTKQQKCSNQEHLLRGKTFKKLQTSVDGDCYGASQQIQGIIHAIIVILCFFEQESLDLVYTRSTCTEARRKKAIARSLHAKAFTRRGSRDWSKPKKTQSSWQPTKKSHLSPSFVDGRLCLPAARPDWRSPTWFQLPSAFARGRRHLCCVGIWRRTRGRPLSFV